MKQLQRELTDLRERGLGEAAEVFLEKYKRRFCDLSLFVKEVKERFSRWYNRKHQRIGTLWAGIVDDSKDYRWCGYAEAVGGSRQARRGLCRVMDQPLDTWEDRKNLRTGKMEHGSGAWYRCWLMLDGKQVEEDEGTRANHVKIRKGVPAEKADEALGNKGMLPPAELVLHRAKYLSEGVAIGSQSFVASLFEKHRELFGVKRKVEAKPAFGEKCGMECGEKEDSGGFELYSLVGSSASVFVSDPAASASFSPKLGGDGLLPSAPE